MAERVGSVVSGLLSEREVRYSTRGHVNGLDQIDSYSMGDKYMESTMRLFEMHPEYSIIHFSIVIVHAQLFLIRRSALVFIQSFSNKHEGRSPAIQTPCYANMSEIASVPPDKKGR